MFPSSQIARLDCLIKFLGFLERSNSNLFRFFSCSFGSSQPPFSYCSVTDTWEMSNSDGEGSSSSSSSPGRHREKEKDGRPRHFDSRAKTLCWARADIVPGRHPERWRKDAAGNIVCKRFCNCSGCLCFEYDHIIPFSKG